MKDMDWVKFILLASVVLCLTGAGLYAYQVHDLETLKNTIPTCQKKLTDIGRLSAEVDERKMELERDKRQELKPNQYIEQQANNAGISYRRHLILKPLGERKNQKEGYLDRPYEIVPERKQKFDRRKIAKFIFNLEVNTNRLKVTKFTLDQPNTNNYEEWNMILEVTERAPLEK